MVGKSEQEKRFSVAFAELLEYRLPFRKEQIKQAVIDRWVGRPMGRLNVSEIVQSVKYTEYRNIAFVFHEIWMN